MTSQEKSSPARKPRADALRNRALLLERAKAAFAEKGAGASLEEIARTAGFGIGTLYRHFPTRDDLVEAVYRNEVAQLAEAARRLSETEPPVEALRQWMLVFIDYLGTKHGMSEALNSLVGGTSAIFASSGTQTRQSIQMLVDRAVATGEIRLAMDPIDLLRAIAGVANTSPDAGWREAARRLVDILIAGMRVPRPD